MNRLDAGRNRQGPSNRPNNKRKRGQNGPENGPENGPKMNISSYYF